MKPRTIQLISLLALLLPLLAAAETLSGRVVKVVDGDAVHVLDNAQERHKIRLAGIDAPERKQAFGKKAKEHLSSSVAGETVKVDWNKRDRYKRVVGKIIHQGRDINLEMVRAGLAWWYRKYAREQNAGDRVLYEAAEHDAQENRRGLWVDPQPVAPWVWRKRK
jgi:endonuclease YncB( thermonuclease family)